MTKQTWAVQYERPDGWWRAGTGFASKDEAEQAAREQLRPNVKWRVVPAAKARKQAQLDD